MRQLAKRFWRWFSRPPRVSRGQWLRDLAFSLWLIPPIMMFPLTFGVLARPAILLEDPIIGLLYGIPLALGALLFWLSRRGSNRLPL